MNEVAVGVLHQAESCFSSARQRIAEGMELLFRISNDKLWEHGGYSGFGDFCESGCGISESFGSKLVKVYKHYVVDSGLSQRKLEEIDAEKLYLAIGLTGEVDEKLAKADTLTRRELKDELAIKDGTGCSHENTIVICADCHKRM